MNLTKRTDAEALAELVRTHGPGLLNYATRVMGGDRSGAEDVVQETWLRAWRNLDRLTEHRGSVRGWLNRVAHNIAVDHHRARAARPAEVELTDLDVERTPDVADHVSSVENGMVVAELLTHISHKHRSVIHEVYFEDRTFADTANVLGIAEGTAKSRAFHALRQLRSAAQPLAA